MLDGLNRYRRKHSIAQPFSPDGCDPVEWEAVGDVVAKCDAAAEAALQDADCRSTGKEAALFFASAWARHGLQYVNDNEQLEGGYTIEIDEHDPLRAVEAIVQLLCKGVHKDRES
jgi:hypothetical protein